MPAAIPAGDAGQPAAAGAKYSPAPMLDHVMELTHLVARWVHLIAGIMWIGNSMLFNWLDRNLEKHHPGLSRLSQGKIFMLHSGAFYDVEKKLLEPGEIARRQVRATFFVLGWVAERYPAGMRVSGGSERGRTSTGSSSQSVPLQRTRWSGSQ